MIKDRVTFLKTAAETDGAYTLVEVELAPSGGNGLHYHVDYIEEFEVVQGTLGLQMGKENIALCPGQSATVPIKAVHRFYNPSQEEPVVFRTLIRPARQFEQMIRIAYGLANDGKTNAKGMPNLWYLAIMFEKGETYFPTLPWRLQKGIFGLLARLARYKGKDRDLFRYYMERE